MKTLSRRHRLHPSVIDFCSCPDRPHHFPQKGRLLSLRLGQSHTNLRAADGEGDSGKPRTRAVVQEGFYVRGKMLGGKGTLHKMATDDLCRFTNGGQAQARVPAHEQPEICRELLVAACRQFANASLRKGLFYLLNRPSGKELTAGQRRSMSPERAPSFEPPREMRRRAHAMPRYSRSSAPDAIAPQPRIAAVRRPPMLR